MAQSAYCEEVLNRERGITWSPYRNIPPSSQKLSIQVNFTKRRIFPGASSSSLRRRSAINAIVYHEDCMIILNSDGVLSLFISQNFTHVLPITKIREKAIKFFVKENTLFFFSKLNTEGFTRFYKLNLHQLRAGQSRRERLLRHTRFPPTCLKSIDSNNLKVIVIENGFLEVWDLESQSIQFRCGKNSWYTRNSVVETTSDPSGTIFTLTDLQDMQRRSLVLQGFNKPLQHVEVIGNFLVLCFGRVIVIDVELKSVHSDHGNPKLIVETNVMKELLMIYEDKTACCMFSPNLSVNVNPYNDPVFCDTEDTFVFYDSGKVSIVHKDHGLLSVSRVSVRQTVNCISVNENLSEVFLGCENGQIIILEKINK